VVVQANNAVVREFGAPRQEEKLYNHVDLVQLLDIVNLEAGTTVSHPGDSG
jgi:seryl-tRNA synthetase